ncbi:hypothetical protein [Cerasicoccus maritimus]|uniref:hypothetical protein n=1 Tax=Cerasicoccus maritimus TaxID=490089 RepID=UPI0028527391|nr:hypothetical protein [Cerasicoccus maritimus]
MDSHFPRNTYFARWPKVTEADGVMTIASTGIMRRLGLLRVDTVINIPRGSILITRKCGWRAEERHHIERASISHLDHHLDRPYDSTWGMSSTEHGPSYLQDVYRISVITLDEQKHELCSFVGRPFRFLDQKITANEPSPLTGYLNQQKHGAMELGYDVQQISYEFAERLRERLDVPLGRNVDDEAFMVTCPACDCRTSRHKTTCAYCGADWSQRIAGA